MILIIINIFSTLYKLLLVYYEYYVKFKNKSFKYNLPLFSQIL